MSDQGGSDLDVFESLSKKPAGGDSKEKTLTGLTAPLAPKVSKAPPPPPSKSVPPPPGKSAPSAVAAPPPPAPSAAAAPPPPAPSVAVAPLPPPPSAAMAPPPPAPSKAAAPPPPAPSAAMAPPPPAPSKAAAPPPPAPSAAVAPPPPTPSMAAAPPPPPTPSMAAAPPPPPTSSAVAAPPPPTPASSQPLAPPSAPDSDWDDDDEKTTVFDRSHEESAQALLQKPTPAAGAPAAPVASAPAPQVSAPAPVVSQPAAPVVAPSAPAAVSAPAFSPAASMPMAAPAPSSGGSKVGIIVGGVAVAAIAAAAFFMMGGEKPSGLVVQVAGPGGTAVSGVKVIVDDDVKCESSTCKLSDLKPGSYIVKAVADGYVEMAGKVYEVAPGEQKAINIELVAAASTGLKVTTEAPGLTLSIDGKKIGALPQELSDITPGEHKIELSGSEFFEKFSETVTVKKGEVTNFEPKLKLIQGQVTIKLDPDAEGAKVSLVGDGKSRPLNKVIEKGAPLILPVDGKDYVIKASKKGFDDYEQKLTFSVEEPVKTLTISLNEEGSEDEAKAPAASQSPSTSPTPAPAPSPAPQTQTTPTPSPAPAPAPAPAASGQGKLNINSIPVSSVILDGRPVGTTPKMGLSVSAGTHTVVFVHPQHGRKSRTVTVAAGQTATAAVRFP